MIKEALPHIYELIEKYKPKSFGEIGSHEGLTARLLCHKILEYHPRLTYVGYDAYEEVPKIEHNGKSTPNQIKLVKRLNWLQRKFKHFKYELIVGYTNQTLITPRKFGIVYVDGGHSYETVKHDYSMIKDSKIIIFDDYNLGGVKKAVDEIGKGYQMEFNTERGKNKKWVIIN